MPQGHSENSPRNTGSIDKRVKALELRKRGYTYQRIADKLELPGASSAYALIKAAMTALREECRESVEELRDLEVSKMDMLWGKMLQHLSSPKSGPSAASAMVKIAARKAALLGLDMPTKVDATVTIQKLYAVREASPDVFPPAPGEIVAMVPVPAQDGRTVPSNADINASEPLDVSTNQETDSDRGLDGQPV